MRVFITLIFIIYNISLLYAENILNIAISNKVGNLNPQDYGQNAMFAQNMIYEGLVKSDKNGVIIPSLATSWEIKDSKTYIFHLRKNVKFSNGEDFNANAVKKNFDSILKNRVRHSWARLASIISEVKVLDSYSIEIKLTTPYLATLDELSLIRPFRFIAPSEIPDDLDLLKVKPKPIGTGAYIYQGSVKGVSDTFVKNTQYWDKARYNGIYFDKIIMRHILDSTSKVIALKSGQIDLIYGLEDIPIEVFNSFKNDSRFNTFVSKPISSLFLALNPKNIEPKVREAITKSIDKIALNKAVFYSTQNVAKSIFYDKANFDSIFDIKKAKEILESSGYILQNSGFYAKNGKILELHLMYEGNSPLQKAIAEILQMQLKNVGISVKLDALEPSMYMNAQRSAAFDMCFSITWGVPYEPLIIINAMKVGGHVFSIHKYLKNNDIINANINKILESSINNIKSNENTNEQDIKVSSFNSLNFPNLDSKSRQNLESNLLKTLNLLIEANIYIPLHYPTNRAIAKKNLKGINMGVLSYEIPFFEFYR